MFDARKGQITITRGDTGLLAIVPTGYVPTSQDRMFFMVAEMPDGRIVINKTVTPDDDGVCKLMFSGTDTENLSKRHREYTYAIRFALDVTESNGKITGYREMITPEPPGCFVVLEANGCPACTCETQNVGSMEVKLESFRGPKGDRGEKGDKGDRGAKGEPGKDAVIDATLTQDGEAADAAATGKRLAEIEKAVAEKADKARQNILIGSETGNPVSVSDAFSAPLCGLTVYGKSTQDGTPSPDNPVPIVSAGDGGTIGIKITGKNLISTEALFSPTKTAFVVIDGHIKGTTTTKYAQIGYLLQSGYPAQYTASVSGGSKTVETELRAYKWVDGKLGNLVVQGFFPVGQRATISFSTDGKSEYFVFFRPYDVSDFDYYDMQLELGTTATAYEPYREQLLTLPTPNGLPGIPVTSGGNYTDQSGQQWVCDEIDLERGVKVQRMDKAAFDSTKTLAEQNAAILATPVETPLTPEEIAAYKSLTTYAPNTVVQAAHGAGLKLDYQRDVNITIKKLEDAIASMTTT